MSKIELKRRKCPNCGSMTIKAEMKFRLEQIYNLNESYNLDLFKKTFTEYEDNIIYNICNECSLVYSKFIWPDSLLNEVYSNIINHDRSRQKIYDINKTLELVREWNSILRVLKFLGKKRTDELRILDFGCGWGDFIHVIDCRGVQIYGFDEDKIKIDEAKKNGCKIFSSIDDLKNNKPFDVIILNSVLEHIQDVNGVLQLLYELLNTNGLLITLVMDYRPRFIKLNYESIKKGELPLTKNLNPIEHVNIYSYKTLKENLKANNFELLTTGVSLSATNIPFVRNSWGILKLITQMEKLTSKIVAGRNMDITVYSIKRNMTVNK